jgi:ATP-dependent DNA helicase RecQ
MSLQQKEINSDYLGSTQTNPDVTNNALNGFYNVLYMTPERAMGLTNRYFNDGY